MMIMMGNQKLEPDFMDTGTGAINKCETDLHSIIPHLKSLPFVYPNPALPGTASRVLKNLPTQNW